MFLISADVKHKLVLLLLLFWEKLILTVSFLIILDVNKAIGHDAAYRKGGARAKNWGNYSRLLSKAIFVNRLKPVRKI